METCSPSRRLQLLLLKDGILDTSLASRSRGDFPMEISHIPDGILMRTQSGVSKLRRYSTLPVQATARVAATEETEGQQQQVTPTAESPQPEPRSPKRKLQRPKRSTIPSTQSIPCVTLSPHIYQVRTKPCPVHSAESDKPRFAGRCQSLAITPFNPTCP